MKAAILAALVSTSVLVAGCENPAETVSENGIVTVTATLQAEDTIRAPIHGMDVYLNFPKSWRGDSIRATTNDNGQVRWTDLRHGNYRISAKVPAWEDETITRATCNDDRQQANVPVSVTAKPKREYIRCRVYR